MPKLDKFKPRTFYVMPWQDINSLDVWARDTVKVIGGPTFVCNGLGGFDRVEDSKGQPKPFVLGPRPNNKSLADWKGE